MRIAFDRARAVQRHLEQPEAGLEQHAADGGRILRRQAAQDGDQRQCEAFQVHGSISLMKWDSAAR
jgi:hypothetical protein